MFEEANIINYEWDTSHKKYPYNKYYNTKELAKITTKSYRSKTIDHSKNRYKANKKNKKSLMSTKTMTSSRIRPSSRHQNTLPITQQNYRAFTKDDLASELHHYQELCLQLRKENYSLKTKMDEKSRKYKGNLVEFQKKINKFNEKSLQLKEKQLKLERDKIVQERKGIVKKGKEKPKAKANHRHLEGEFKRFFLHFVDNYGKVDERVQKRMSHQKTMQQKLLLSQRLLKQGCEYLLQKKYKFDSVYE